MDLKILIINILVLMLFSCKAVRNERYVLSDNLSYFPKSEHHDAQQKIQCLSTHQITRDDEPIKVDWQINTPTSLSFSADPQPNWGRVFKEVGESVIFHPSPLSEGFKVIELIPRLDGIQYKKGSCLITVVSKNLSYVDFEKLGQTYPSNGLIGKSVIRNTGKVRTVVTPNLYSATKPQVSVVSPEHSLNFSSLMYIPSKGFYSFASYEERPIQFQIGSKSYLLTSPITVKLDKGYHRVIFYWNEKQIGSSRTLLWKHPGQFSFSVVPSHAFHLIPSPEMP